MTDSKHPKHKILTTAPNGKKNMLKFPGSGLWSETTPKSSHPLKIIRKRQPRLNLQNCRISQW